MMQTTHELLEHEIYPRLNHQIVFSDRNYVERGNCILMDCPNCGKKKFYAYHGKPFGFCYITSCGYKTTWWQYVQTRFNISPNHKREILRKLAGMAGYPLPPLAREDPHDSKGKTIETFHQDLYRWGRQQLFSEQGKTVLDCVLSRGFTYEEVEKRTEFCAIPNRKKFVDIFCNQKGYKIDQIKEAGLLGWGFGINYQLIFPNRDENGKIVAWAGRLTVPGKDREGEELDRYKNTFGLHKNVPYNFWRAKRSIERTKQVLVVEGYMDALHCYAKGFENVVAIFGSRLLKEQMAWLAQTGVSQVLLCLDNDKDGEAGSEKAFDLFLEHPRSHPYYVILPPDCKDPDETLKKHEKTDFEQMLKIAQPGWLWYAGRITAQYDDTPDRDALLNRYGNIYNKIQDPVIRDEFLRTLSGHTEIGMLNLKRRFRRISDTRTKKKKDAVLEDFRIFLVDLSKKCLSGMDLSQLRAHLLKTLSTQYFPPRDPYAIRFRDFIKQGLNLVLKLRIKEIEQQIALQLNWIEEVQHKERITP